MRISHSSRGLRIVGGLAVAAGTFGLAMQQPVRTFAQEQLAAPELGAETPDATLALADLLGGDVPDSLTHGYIESALPADVFGEDVLQLGYDTSTVLSQLYEDEPDAEAAADLLSDLKAKRQEFDGVMKKTTDAGQRAQLREVVGRFDGQIALISALNALTESDDLSDPTVSLAYGTLAARVDAAQADLRGFTTGSAWAKYFRLDELANLAQEASDDEAATDVLAAAAERFGSADRFDDEQKAFVDRPSLNNVADAIEALQTTLNDGDAEDGLQTKLRELVEAFNSAQQYGSADAALTIRLASDWLPKVGGNAEPLLKLVRDQFFADNFRLDVSESLVRRILANSSVESGLVNECVFGTRVVGEKCTASDLTIDVKPSTMNARIDLLVSGTVDTNTRGLDPKATVFTRGNHTFTAHKKATFDGYRLAATNATVSVNINSRTVGVAPKTKLPIIKQIVKNVAIDRARELRPRTNALQRSKITRQVTSRFDSKFASLIAKADDRLNKQFYQRLRHAGLYPERQSVSSTDETVDVSSRMMTSSEVAASRPSVTPFPTTGLAAQIHESYINNALSRMDFAGREMNSEEIRAEIERYLEIVAGRDLDMGSRSVEAEPAEEVDEELEQAKFLFDDADPMRVRIESGSIYLILKAGLQTANETIAPQIIEIPLALDIVDGDLMMNKGRIEVTPFSRPRNRARQIAHAKLIAKKIKQSLPDRRIEGEFDVELESKVVPLRLRSADAYAGWLTMRMD